MIIKLPRGLSIDIDNPPENLEELVQKAFAEYTYGTSREYTDEDRLTFIDLMIERTKFATDANARVHDLLLERFDWEIFDQGRIPDRDDFFDVEFFEYCFEQGQKHANLIYRNDDHHISDKANRFIARIVRAIMTWKRPPDPDPCTITFTLDEPSTATMLKFMEELNAKEARELFEPGNRFDLICGDRKITYVAQEATEC